MSCSPASVGVTLRVVRASSRTPIRSSSLRRAWLRAEAETSRRLAALVKLLFFRHHEEAESALSWSRVIPES